MQAIVEQSRPLSPRNKKLKPRKWREIEDLKARQQLAKELHSIDQSFKFSISDLI